MYSLKYIFKSAACAVAVASMAISTVISSADKRLKVYVDGELAGQSKCNGGISFSAGKFMIGRSEEAVMSGQMMLNTFNGLRHRRNDGLQRFFSSCGCVQYARHENQT